jgi:hypothetical protein
MKRWESRLLDVLHVMCNRAPAALPDNCVVYQVFESFAHGVMPMCGLSVDSARDMEELLRRDRLNDPVRLQILDAALQNEAGIRTPVARRLQELTYNYSNPWMHNRKSLIGNDVCVCIPLAMRGSGTRSPLGGSPKKTQWRWDPSSPSPSHNILPVTDTGPMVLPGKLQSGKNGDDRDEATTPQNDKIFVQISHSAPYAPPSATYDGMSSDGDRDPWQEALQGFGQHLAPVFELNTEEIDDDNVGLASCGDDKFEVA